ncbi:MAG: hypothetical protein NC489_47175 [Ruminococcus flavefaciens]|nr:hypothetical protein [Ruminococcus flavefaciens]
MLGDRRLFIWRVIDWNPLFIMTRYREKETVLFFEEEPYIRHSSMIYTL